MDPPLGPVSDRKPEYVPEIVETYPGILNEQYTLQSLLCQHVWDGGRIIHRDGRCALLALHAHGIVKRHGEGLAVAKPVLGLLFMSQ